MLGSRNKLLKKSGCNVAAKSTNINFDSTALEKSLCYGS